MVLAHHSVNLPWFTLVPPTGPHPIGGHIWVPIDDENCWAWSINFYPDRPLSGAERAEMEAGKGIHVAYIPGSFRPVANKDNDYLIDRAAQKDRRSYSGVIGLSMQDASLQESMGPIQDRSTETLVNTDRAIVLARRLLYRTASEAAAGSAMPGLDPATQRVRAASVLLDKTVDVEDWARAALRAESATPLYSL